MDALRGLQYVRHDFGDSPTGRWGDRSVTAERAAAPRATGLSRLGEKLTQSIYNAVLDKAHPARVDINARAHTRALSEATGALIGMLSQGSQIDRESAAVSADQAIGCAAELLGSSGDAPGQTALRDAVVSERMQLHLRNMSPAQMSTLQDGLQSLTGSSQNASFDLLHRLVRDAVKHVAVNNLSVARANFAAAARSGQQMSPALLADIAQRADAYTRAHSTPARQLLPDLTTDQAWALLSQCAPGTPEAALVATHLQIQIEQGAITPQHLAAQQLPTLRQAIDSAPVGSPAYRTLAGAIFERTGTQATALAKPLGDSFLRSAKALLDTTNESDLKPKTNQNGTPTAVCQGFLKDSMRAIFRMVSPEGRIEEVKFASQDDAEKWMVHNFGDMAMDLSKLANQGLFAYATRDFDPEGLAEMAPPSVHSPIKRQDKDLELNAKVAPTIYTFRQADDGSVTLKAETARLLVSGYNTLDVEEVAPGRRMITGGLGETPTSCDPVGTYSYYSAELTATRSGDGGQGPLGLDLAALPVMSFNVSDLPQPHA